MQLRERRREREDVEIMRKDSIFVSVNKCVRRWRRGVQRNFKSLQTHF